MERGRQLESHLFPFVADVAVRVAFLEDVFTHNIHCVAAVVKTGWWRGQNMSDVRFAPGWVEGVQQIAYKIF